MTRYLAALLSPMLLLGLTGCGRTTPRHVPYVTDEQLDVAEDALDAAGLRYHTVGGGLFGIVIRSDWVVCRQTPRAGALATSVTLVVGRRWCDPYSEEDE